ncbi:MAG TPA: glycosyltransferase family 39 protein [Methylomirabilota bacterium]
MTRGAWVPPLVLSALAIGVRLLVATRREGIEVDGILYLANAAALVHDRAAFNPVHQPLYSLVLAPVVALASDPEWAARVVAAVAGGLWVLPTLWLARETTDAPVAWPAGLLVALMPAAVDAGTRVLPDTLLVLLVTTTLAAAMWAARTARPLAAAVTGAAGALATLAHPVGVGFLTLAIALLALAPRWTPPAWRAPRPLVSAGAIALAALLVLGPQILFVRQLTGTWSWTGKRLGYTLTFSEHVGAERAMATAERLTAEVKREDAPPSMLAYAWRSPGALVQRIVINLHLVDKYTLPGLLQAGGIVLVAFGLVHLRVRRTPPEWVLPVALAPCTGLLLFNVESRYFVPAIPVLAIIAAIGVARLGQPRPAEAERRRLTLGTVALVIALLSFVPWLARPWFREDASGVDKTAGRWLATAGVGPAFLGRYPVIGYYAGARAIPLGGLALDAALAEGRRQGARFLVVDSERLPMIRPDLLPLLAGTSVGRADLELVKVVEDRAGRRVLIYRIAGTL